MKNQQSEKQLEKVLFRLEKDEDGYPPDDWESVWGIWIDTDLYRLDNIPFFVKEISYGDIVAVKRIKEELYFDRVVRQSDHSVIRIVVFDRTKVHQLHDKLKELKCDTEQSHLPGLLSVDVPAAADIEGILQFLDDGENNGFWEYEEASPRCLDAG